MNTTQKQPPKKKKPAVKKKTVKNIRVEPNVAAGIFLLTNIAPDRWRNRQNIDATTNGKDIARDPITIEVIDRREQVIEATNNDADSDD